MMRKDLRGKNNCRRELRGKVINNSSRVSMNFVEQVVENCRKRIPLVLTRKNEKKKVPLQFLVSGSRTPGNDLCTDEGKRRFLVNTSGQVACLFQK